MNSESTWWAVCGQIYRIFTLHIILVDPEIYNEFNLKFAVDIKVEREMWIENIEKKTFT